MFVTLAFSVFDKILLLEGGDFKKILIVHQENVAHCNRCLLNVKTFGRPVSTDVEFIQWSMVLFQSLYLCRRLRPVGMVGWEHAIWI